MTRDGKAAARAVWGATPAGHRFAAGAEPGTREYFETARTWRSAHDVPWQYAIVPFASWRDKEVLEIGCGAGFDAHEICRNGARYTGVDITPENIQRTRQHLDLDGFLADLRVADAEQLPFGDGSFDIVFSSGVLHHVPDIEQAFGEARRVLREDGEFWVILYHRDSIFHWLTMGLWEHVLHGGFRHRSFKERVAMIEDTTSPELPIVNVYSRAQVRSLLERSGFAPKRVWVRKLEHADLPASRRFMWIPRSWLDVAARYWGWYVIARAVKHG
jgi:ubiquinone/menaquinone biosynthesis C-methylase UbiE